MSESKSDALPLGYEANSKVVERDGFEPSNSMRTDLQSVAFSHFATSPKKWCRNQDLNPEPTDYKSVALPIELFRHHNEIIYDNNYNCQYIKI